MSNKLQTLKRLKDARQRIRDVAAAHAGEAGRALQQAQTYTASIERSIDDRMNNPPIRATRAADWLGFAEEIDRARALQQAAMRAQAQAHEQSRKLQHELTLRERAVRSCEKQIDNERTARAARRSQAEQALADDLSSTRVR